MGWSDFSQGPTGTRMGSTLINSLRGGTRILLLMAHQPIGWTSTVPRLHQKSWLASFSKPSYRSSTRYPEQEEGEVTLRPSCFSSLNQAAYSKNPFYNSQSENKPLPCTWKAVWHSRGSNFLRPDLPWNELQNGSFQTRQALWSPLRSR